MDNDELYLVANMPSNTTSPEEVIPDQSPYAEVCECEGDE